jgi:hypothetical protein
LLWRKHRGPANPVGQHWVRLAISGRYRGYGPRKARGDFVARRIRRIEQAAEGGTWTADAWAVERIDPDTWGRRDRLDVSGTMTVVEMRAFFVAVMGLLERYVPPERLDAEVSNLIAVTDEIAGGMQDRLGAG